MFTFQKQKQILEPVLKNPANSKCADCHAIAPSWASLDFGVFVCSDCAGAHRSLGPTITRVKSANLDLWQEQWLPLMMLGNEAINSYWEADPSAQLKKPKSGATADEICRFAYVKYVKKKFVKDATRPDPLTLHKQNGFRAVAVQSPKAKPVIEETKPQVVAVPEPVATTKPKTETNLLDFDFELPPGSNPPVSLQAPQPPQVTSQNAPVPLQQTHPVQQAPLAASVTQHTEHATSFTAESTGSNLMSFDQLMSQHQSQPQPPPSHHLSQQSLSSGQHYNPMQLHHPYHPNQGQNNLVYNAHYQQASQLTHPQPAYGHYNNAYHPHQHHYPQPYYH